MSDPNASSSSSALVAFAQDVNYTQTEGFKRFKASYNWKNACAARNDPRRSYPCAEDTTKQPKDQTVLNDPSTVVYELLRGGWKSA